ncbi:hypothetical protein CVT25_001011 [Psilocybe cyanescens]|uniref:CxC2-like cysteine cluster KDZ transposase-associated domain-containing protein n=1 Tax=Psilocybe cyanescens TaxID=93625 RepID=A0A409WZ58_PSICY|nr:hypothetical protein CVT25_001011 [Psilocybe cyanescens]
MTYTQCCAEAHNLLPYHRINKWNGYFFQVGALWETGLQLYLGHGSIRCRSTQDGEHHLSEQQPLPVSEDDEWGDAEEEAGAEPPEGQELMFEILVSGTHPNSLPLPPRYNTYNNPFMMIVDISGIHHLPVVHCSCHGPTAPQDLNYLKLSLFPASFKTI